MLRGYPWKIGQLLHLALSGDFEEIALLVINRDIKHPHDIFHFKLTFDEKISSRPLIAHVVCLELTWNFLLNFYFEDLIFSLVSSFTLT